MKVPGFSILVMLILTFATMAYGADKDKFVGTWKLISMENFSSTPNMPYENPSGYLMYDSTSHMAVQIMRRQDCPKFASGKLDQGTPQEIKAAFLGYGAYYGTYELREKEGLVIHHIEGSLFPNEIGTDNIRYYEFFGDRVRLTIPAIIDGKVQPKSPNARSLVWERVK